MRKQILILILLGLLVTACSPSAAEQDEMTTAAQTPTTMATIPSSRLMLEYTFIIGGSGDEGPGWLHAPHLAPDGTLYLTGDTTSRNFPTSADALVAEYQGGNSDGMEDTVLVAFDTRQAEVTYATYLGGAKGPEFISDIYVDAEQNIYLAGNTGSSDYPQPPTPLSRNSRGRFSDMPMEPSPSWAMTAVA